MSTKAQRLKGKARVSDRYNQPWRGFTLQRGHFYGETVDGVYFVTGLESRKDGKVKVYLGTAHLYSNEYNWTVHWCDPGSHIVQLCIAEIPRRNRLGIDHVEFKPLEKQKTGYNPRTTSEKPYPYDPVRIPAAGKNQTHYIKVGDNDAITNKFFSRSNYIKL